MPDRLGTDNKNRVRDPELRAWLQLKVSEPRELIVQVQLPRRHIAIHRTSGSRSSMRSRGDGVYSERIRRLSDLYSVISKVVSKSVLLTGAGAIAIRATPAEVLRFVDNPLVKEIRQNRRVLTKQR